MSIEKTRQYLQQMYEKNILEGLPSGYWDWDQLSGGFAPGTVTLIGGRPGMGATSLAMNIADHVSKNYSGTVVICTTQMREEETVLRLMQIGMRTSAHKFLDGTLSDEVSIDTFRRYFSRRQGKISITALHRPDFEDILWKSQDAGDLRLLIVDSIDSVCIRPEGVEPWDFSFEPAPRDQVLASLKDIAQLLRVPVICTTHMHRSLEKRKNKRPKLRDLAKIGIPEEAADQIVFLHRDRYFEWDSAEGAECIVAKSPRGLTGTARLSWDWEIGLFQNL